MTEEPNQYKRAALRHLNQDGSPSASWLNRPIAIHNDKKWSFWDLETWTGVSNRQDLVQAIVNGVLELDEHELIERILELGGLIVSEGPKEPLP
jgi:hypothetical protein